MLWGGKRATPADAESPVSKKLKSDDQFETEKTSEPEIVTASQHAGAPFKVVELDVEEYRQALRDTTVFGFVPKMFPPAPKIKLFLEKDYELKDVEMLHRGFFAIHLSSASEASKLLSRIKLDYEGDPMYLFPWTDDFNPNEPGKLLQPVWIKLRHLPLEYRQGGALVAIAERLGKFISLEAGKVSRICVAVRADDVVDVVHLKTTTCENPYVQPVEYEDLCFYGVEHAHASSCVLIRM